MNLYYNNNCIITDWSEWVIIPYCLKYILCNFLMPLILELLGPCLLPLFVPGYSLSADEISACLEMYWPCCLLCENNNCNQEIARKNSPQLEMIRQLVYPIPGQAVWALWLNCSRLFFWLRGLGWSTIDTATTKTQIRNGGENLLNCEYCQFPLSWLFAPLKIEIY